MVYITQIPSGLDRKAQVAAERRAGWGLLRMACRERGKQLPVDIKSAMYVGPHGKPFLKGDPFYYNISHSRGLAACAVEDSPVGVDVERRRVFSDALAERVCTPAEAALVGAGPDRDSTLTHLWTAKESHMKFTGMGMAQGIVETAFCALDPVPQLENPEEPCFFHSQALVCEGQAFWLTECCAADFTLEVRWVDFSTLPEG